MQLSSAQRQQFKIDGYLVLPSLIKPSTLERLKLLTQQHLRGRIPPFELEAEVQYPGAPDSVYASGGDTIRRLQMAYQRNKIFANIATMPPILGGIQEILQSQQVWLNPNHHNCVMTKQAEFSSETLWHRDTRYWNFSDKYLINAWFALGDEKKKNGALKILPGSHRWEIHDQALDEAQFLKLDHPDNLERLRTQRLVELNACDVLLFSAHCFHAASKNTTQSPKFSLVFTYHGENTTAIAGTRSDAVAEIRLI